jgi:hypothetical protein
MMVASLSVATGGTRNCSNAWRRSSREEDNGAKGGRSSVNARDASASQ